MSQGEIDPSGRFGLLRVRFRGIFRINILLRELEGGLEVGYRLGRTGWAVVGAVVEEVVGG